MKNPQVNYSEIIAETTSKHWNVRDEFKDNTAEENRAICKADSILFSVGIINVTGDLNVGMMIRTASLLGANDVFVFGRKKIDKRSSVGAENYIDVTAVTYDDPLFMANELVDDISEICDYNCLTPVIVEQGGHSGINLNDNGISTNFGGPMFIFGSESHGVPQAVCDAFAAHKISIPQRGVLRSYNVSTAMSIVCWEYVRDRI